jgi:prepilin-type N-terminal cleavage/methylation domain-containing protein
MRKTRKGFSLIELMVAVFILSSSLLLIIGMFTFLFNSSKKGVDITAGTAAGEMILEEYLYSNQVAIYNMHNSPISTVNLIRSVNGVTFRCEIQVSTPAADSLRKVDATVYWFVDAGNSVNQARTYKVQQPNGTWTTVTVDAGNVAEYGAAKTVLTKYVFITQPH